jgi:hypothetical protein
LLKLTKSKLLVDDRVTSTLYRGGSIMKKFFIFLLLILTLWLACNDGGSSDSNIPPGLNLLTSECPAQDIIDIPVFEGFTWECDPTSGGEKFIAPTLSDLSNAIDCFSTVSRTDAFCEILVLGKSSFMATRLQFDLENLPPPGELGCNPDIAISQEEVVCETIRMEE